MSTAWEMLARALSPVEDRPLVAPGLESASYTTRSGAKYVVVHNPAARSYARLDPREFALLPLMDGQVIAVESGRLFVLEREAFDALVASDLAVRTRLETALAYRSEVSEMPLFRDLSAVDVDLLLARLVPLAAAAGQTIIRQGAEGGAGRDCFYVGRSGGVEVSRHGERLARLGAGDAFGEIALLLDVPRTASITALEPTQLLALEAHDFRDLLAGHLGRAGQLERLSQVRLRTHRRLDEVA